MTASIGIALYPRDGEDLDTLVARADAAMYESKRQRTGAARLAQSAADRQLADLREANERLVLAALDAQELRAAAELARERQTALLAVVTRELRNPTAPIRIAAAMLGRPAADDPLLPRVQHIVEQQVAQITRLVDAADMESGALELQRRPVDMVQVVDHAIANCRPEMEARGQQFARARPPDALHVQGDAALLEQAVSNLLDNASRHTQDGGRIELSVSVEAGALTLAVSDNGIGITPRQLPLIFEPFVQDPRALGLEGVGLGLGLTVARALIHAHDGQIAAYSEGASRGSRFVVTLPLAANATVAAAAGSATDDPGVVS